MFYNNLTLKVFIELGFSAYLYYFTMFGGSLMTLFKNSFYMKN